jgi:hypothetical protein
MASDRQADDETALREAVKTAKAFIAGRITPLETGRSIAALINPWHPCWDALDGANGPLSNVFVAQDDAHRVHWLGEDVELWHPNVREERRKELADAEARNREPVEEACRALIAHAAQRKASRCGLPVEPL